jgi:hypothetical protein
MVPPDFERRKTRCLLGRPESSNRLRQKFDDQRLLSPRALRFLCRLR